MEISYLKETKESLTIKISGEVNMEERDALGLKFVEIIETIKLKSIKTLYLEMSEVEYIDSIGISFFVKIRKDLKNIGVEIEFQNVSKMIKKIFVILSLDTLFKISESEGNEKWEAWQVIQR